MIYLLTVAVASLATGLMVDGLIGAGSLPASALVPAASVIAESGAHAGHESGGALSIFELICAIVLLGILVNALRPQTRKEMTMGEPDEELIELRVDGMRCNGCVTSIQRALSEISGVSQAEVILDTGIARVHGSGVSADALVDAVTSLGFSVPS